MTLRPLRARLVGRMPASLKQRIKPLAARGLEWRLRWSGRRVGLALCYHKLGDPEGDLERELVPALGADRFAAQVRHLVSRYRLVAASELLAAVAGRRRGGRIPIAVTFDDDLRSHLTEAAPLLHQAGAPATFFLCGASLDGPSSFWWEHLQRAWDQGLVDERLVETLGGAAAYPEEPPIRRVAAAIQALPVARREAVSAELAKLAGSASADAGVGADEIASLRLGGFEVGFHTRHHHVLTSLDDRALAAAMSEGRSDLERVVGGTLSAISYPHGEADQRVAAAARSAGYAFGFAARGGPVDADSDPLLLDRRYPSRGSIGDFALAIVRALRRPAAAD